MRRTKCSSGELVVIVFMEIRIFPGFSYWKIIDFFPPALAAKWKLFLSASNLRRMRGGKYEIHLWKVS